MFPFSCQVFFKQIKHAFISWFFLFAHWKMCKGMHLLDSCIQLLVGILVWFTQILALTAFDNSVAAIFLTVSLNQPWLKNLVTYVVQEYYM